jgi:tRNA A-37 threonylcarbamoyl transferase component Bud32
MTEGTDAVVLRAEGWRILAAPRAAPALPAAVLPDPERRAREGRVLRESLHRVTSRVEWPGVGGVLLKAHRRRGLREALRSLVARSRAAAEWRASRFCRVEGIPAPEPLAFGERRRLGTLDAAFFAAAFLEGHAPLSRALEGAPRRVARALLDRVARAVRAMHDRRFDHEDLHGGNVLVGPGSGDERPVVFADLHRSRVGRAVGPRSRARALAQLLHGLLPVLGPGGRLRVLAAYAPDEPPEGLRALYRRVERRIARFERVRRRSRGKRARLESTVFTRDVGPGAGFRRRDLAPERLDRALAEHDEALRLGDARVAKEGRRGRVTRHGDLVVKESVATGLYAKARGLLVPWRRRWGYLNAHRLGVLGVGTARPLAFLRRGGRTWTLYEDLTGEPRLDHLARRAFRDGSREERRRLLATTADWLARVHRLGVHHGDLKAPNVFVRAREGGPELLLIDTDRCRFLSGPVGLERRCRNLAQLAASIPVVVTRTDRLRWFRRYAAGTPWAAAERDVARRVAALLARKRLVRDEPIE